MTTATVQAQPTAADIRAMVQDREAYGFSGEATPQNDAEPKLVAVLRGLITDYFQAISDPAFAILDATEADWGPLDRSEGPWQDLRPSEAMRLRALIGEAERRAVERARQAIVEEVIAAGLAFVAEYPDAPLAGKAVAS